MISRGPWLHMSAYLGWWSDSNYSLWSCTNVLREYFTFPDDTEKIRFYVTTRPEAGAYEVILAGSGFISINGNGIELCTRLYNFLSNAMREANKTIYFGVEYI